MAKKYWLDPAAICCREQMRDYIREIFGLEEFAGNLDELNDLLSEVAEDHIICIHRDALIAIAGEEYSYRVLMVLMNAAEENPHITIRLRLRAPKEQN